MKMSFDGLVTAAVISELNRILIGAKVQNVRQHNDYDVTLELRNPGASHELFLSADSRFSRFMISSIKRTSLPQPTTFCMTCRKHLGGYFLTGIKQYGFDRIVYLEFEARDLPKRTLAVEIMGKHSNLILFDENNTILAAVKTVGKSVSRVRQILPGKPYELPPGSEKLDIRVASSELFKTLWLDVLPEIAPREAIIKWMLDSFSGFGPFLAQEVVDKAGGGDGLDEQAVSKSFQALRTVVLSEAYQPVTAFAGGESILIYPITPVQCSEMTIRTENSICLAMDIFYNAMISKIVLTDQRNQLVQMIRKSAEYARYQVQSYDRALKEAAGAERHKEIGELLNASAHTIPKGETTVSLVDYYDPDLKEVTIELNPKMSARENADRFFKRYKKLKDAAQTSIARREETLDRLRRLDAARLSVDTAVDVNQIKRLRETLVAEDLLREIKHSEEPGNDRGDFEGNRIRRVITPEGWEILYGENSTSNDYLTQKVAKPNDIWLHARSITGAHVVIRTGGHSGVIPPKVLLEGARIAAANSDAKHSSLVPVDHTHKKYVRKPKGAAPGFVIYRMEKTIDVQP